MRDELNNYGINNPDGFEEERLDARREKYDNDEPHTVKESQMSDQKEASHVSETFDDPITAAAETEVKESANMDLSSEASSSMASASASVGGSLGALAGVVAASVVAAVVVAAVFISMLSIKLSLVMAEMTSLVFEVSVTGAQEEDWENPIYAVLTGEDDVYQEQIIDPNRLTITFNGLQPGKEYRVVVKNDEKTFYSGIYFTATEPSEKGEIVSHLEGTDVYVTVQNAKLKASEHYTLVAKDASGNVVYQIDGVEAFSEYHFTVDQPKDLYFYLMVNGKANAISSIELPEYDFDSGVWTWTDDNLSATVTFADKRGGEPLVLAAAVTRKTTQPTCEKDGAVVYTAKVTYGDATYTEKETVIIESEGHSYEGVLEDGRYTFTCAKCGDTYTVEE